MKRIFTAILAFTLVLCFSACSAGVPQEHIDYFDQVTASMEALEEAVKQLNTALAAVDNTDPATLSPLLEACGQVQAAALSLGELSAPEAFAEVQQLYTQASQDISSGCESYAAAYEGLFAQDDAVVFSFDERLAQAAEYMASAAEKLTQAGQQHEALMNP